MNANAIESFGVQGSGLLRIWGLKCRVHGAEVGIQDPGLRVQGSEFRVQNSLEFEVKGLPGQDSELREEFCPHIESEQPFRVFSVFVK